jgi:hypothetical protein
MSHEKHKHLEVKLKVGDLAIEGVILSPAANNCSIIIQFSLSATSSIENTKTPIFSLLLL